MTHPNTTELENFVTGKLTAARIVEVDEHISSCADCREAVSGMAANKQVAMDLGATLLGVKDCPEYEQLSAYVDNELDEREAAEIAAHVNLCEPCADDVSHIAELRSHAAMRTVITVAPGMSKQPVSAATPIWKRLFAGASAAAVIVVAALAFNATLNTTPTAPGQQTAQVERHNPASVPEANKPVTDSGNVVANSNTPANKPPVVSTPNLPVTPDVSKPVEQIKVALRDGKYQVTEHNGKVVFAKAGAGVPRTAIEARIAAVIDQKLKSGKITLGKPVQLAMAELRVRDGSPFQPSPLAPKLISPAGKMVLSDQPTLTWSKAANADSYRVTILDNDGREVATEVTDKTSLTIPEALPRGEVYTWLVQVRFAESDEWSETTTPASAPAKFGIISTEDYATLRKLQSQGSHLALGAAYESFGLTEEAQREYAALRAANPGSKLAEKLR